MKQQLSQSLLLHKLKLSQRLRLRLEVLVSLNLLNLESMLPSLSFISLLCHFDIFWGCLPSWLQSLLILFGFLLSYPLSNCLFQWIVISLVYQHACRNIRAPITCIYIGQLVHREQLFLLPGSKLFLRGKRKSVYVSAKGSSLT
jgi:hypothetical protein